MRKLIVLKLCRLFALISMLTSPCMAQNSSSDFVNKISSVLNDQPYKEKVFLHVDRTGYVAGEILWYKFYCVDAETHKPSELSKVGYVEILNNVNEPVLQQSISLKNGQGSGSIYLPVSMGSDNYKIRAYTQWAKNFGPETFFEQDISVVNLLDGSPLSSSSGVIDFKIDLLPEGGNLVHSVRNMVGVKVADKRGKGKNFSGTLMESSGDTIARFSSHKFGMGRFSFTPIAGKVYKTVFEIDHRVFERQLPSIVEEGISLHVEPTNDQVKVTISSTEKNPLLTMVVHSRQQISMTEQVSLSNGEAVMVLDKTRLPEGVSCFTLFDRGRPVAERLIFRKPLNVLKITAKALRPELATRRLDSIIIKTTVANDSLVDAGLSLAIYRVDSLSKPANGNILSYFWLSSEVKGIIENASYYFQNDASEEATDNLMVTQGWRKFDWKNLLANDTTKLEFLPEYEGRIIQAKFNGDAKRLKGNSAFLSDPGINFSLMKSKFNDAGEISFVTRDIYGSTSLVVQIDSKQKADLTFRNPFSEKYTPRSLTSLEISKTAGLDMIDRTVSSQVQNVYSKDQLSKFYKKPDPLSFFGKPSKTYWLDDYTRFPTMVEVMTEYVPEVAIRKSQGNTVFKMLESHDAGYFEGEPLLLVDGIPVRNSNTVIALDPLKIKKLDVLNQKFSFGPTTFPGIVSYTGYDNDHSWLTLDSGAVKINYEGLQAQRIFYSPEYQSESELDSKLPDFRTLLYWSSDITTKSGAASVRFYASDLPGQYIGVIQGLTKAGQAGSASFFFNVK